MINDQTKMEAYSDTNFFNQLYSSSLLNIYCALLLISSQRLFSNLSLPSEFVE